MGKIENASSQLFIVFERNFIVFSGNWKEGLQMKVVIENFENLK
jgi:hypothetical protein